VRGERATREVKEGMEQIAAQGQGGMTQADISARIGQLLYSMALQAATGQCQCPTCQAARELAGLLATQLRLGPPSLRPVGP
jgi:hypothetical protein